MYARTALLRCSTVFALFYVLLFWNKINDDEDDIYKLQLPIICTTVTHPDPTLPDPPVDRPKSSSVTLKG